MVPERLLWCPNLVLLDPMEQLSFSDKELIAVFKMATSNKPLLYVKMGHNTDKIIDYQIIIQKDGYAFYKINKKSIPPLFMDKLGDNCPHFYYIFTEPEYLRLAFVHFFDILGADYRIICNTQGLSRFTVPWILVIPELTPVSKEIIKGMEHLKDSKVLSISELT